MRHEATETQQARTSDPGGPLGAREKRPFARFRRAFPEPRPAYTTIQTTVYRLEGKKALRRVRKIGNADIFEPIVARDVTRNRLLDEILSFFGGRAQPMMAQLAEAGKLTLADVRELEKTIKKLEAQQKARKGRVNRNDRRTDEPSVAIDVVRNRGGSADRRVPQEPGQGALLAVVQRVVKFLVPFSLLMSLGSHLGWCAGAREHRDAGCSIAMVANRPAISRAVCRLPITQRHADWIPIAIFGVWACGFVAIALMRFRGWLRIRGAVRSSAPWTFRRQSRFALLRACWNPAWLGCCAPSCSCPRASRNA